MRREVFLVLVCFFQDLASSIKLIELRAPGHVAEGGEALLGCQFDLEGDLLYSVKWYKDGNEFYRYVPRHEPPALMFVTPGVRVDLSRSSSDVVTLKRMTAASAGVYSCEVCGEAPLFTSVEDHKYINVLLLPDSGPRISSLYSHFNIGDRVVLNCSTSPSRPETQLKWWVNDQPAPRSLLQGPWYRMAIYRPDAVETILQLRFTVAEKHFVDGVLKIKCQATIAPLYQDEAVEMITQEDLPEPLGNEDHALMSLDNQQGGVEVTTGSLWTVGYTADSTTTLQHSLLWVSLLLIIFQ